MGVIILIFDMAFLWFRGELNVPLLIAGTALLGVVIPLHYGDRKAP